LEVNMVLTAKNAALAALLSVGLLASGGCTQTQRSTATGAALGAGAGALIGAVTDSSVAGGAVIGGVVGGVAGYCTAQRCFD
jgi:osmotically inducible lipoprotein OsmB